MFDRQRRVLRLSYVVVRAIVHTLAAHKRPGMSCVECNSILITGEDGSVSVYHTPDGRPCPVHVAWRELTRIGLPPAGVLR